MNGRVPCLVALLVGVALAAVPVKASACSCVGPNPVYSAFWQTDAVLVGEVVWIGERPRSMEVIGGESIPTRVRIVRLRVAEVFSGVTSKEVDVETGMGGGDSGYPSKSVRPTSSLDTAVRTGSRPASAHPRGPSIRAIPIWPISKACAVRHPGRDAFTGRSRNRMTTKATPAAGPRRASRMRREGDRDRRDGSVEGSSQINGTYEVLVPAGRYDVRFEVPPASTVVGAWSRPIDIKDARPARKFLRQCTPTAASAAACATRRDVRVRSDRGDRRSQSFERSLLLSPARRANGRRRQLRSH